MQLPQVGRGDLGVCGACFRLQKRTLRTTASIAATHLVSVVVGAQEGAAGVQDDVWQPDAGMQVQRTRQALVRTLVALCSSRYCVAGVVELEGLQRVHQHLPEMLVQRIHERAGEAVSACT